MDLKLMIGLSRAMIYINRRSVDLFRRHGLTSGQFAVLEVLYHKGDLTSKQIKEKILMTPGNLPVIIKNLERDGYISRKQDEDDRRFQIISLTNRGREKIQEVFPENKAMLEEIFSIYTDQEKEILLELLKKFRSQYEKKN